MRARDGGAAFPSPGVVLTNNSGLPQQQGAYEGMTLRDYFAAKAMQALIGPTMSGIKRGGEGASLCAEAAYEVADAMLNAREA